MLKKIFCIFIAFLLVVGGSMTAFAFTPTDFKVSAKAGLVVTYDTNEYIYDKNSEQKLNITALSFVMSGLVIAEKCPDLDAYSAEMTLEVKKRYLGTGLKVIEMKIGGKYTVRELISLALIGSYSDAMYLAAITVFGSEGDCVNAMNQKAAELGMADTVFVDLNGFEASQYSTARDVAKMFKAACENSVIKEIMSTRKYTLSKNEYREKATGNFDSVSFSNSCMIINPGTVHFYNKVVAGKSGTTDAAGRCIVTLGEEKGNRYICVLLGEPQTTDRDQNGNTIRYDFIDTKNLIGWAISNFSYRMVLSKGDIIASVPIRLASDIDSITVAAASDLYATLPKSTDNSTLDLTRCHYKEENFRAPIEAGESLGYLEVYFADEKIGEVELVAAIGADVSVWLVIEDAVVSVITSKWFTALVLIILALVVSFILTLLIMNLRRKIKRSKKVHKDKF